MQSANEKFQVILQQLLAEMWSRLVQEYQMTVNNFESRLVDMDIENMSLRDAADSLKEQLKEQTERDEAPPYESKEERGDFARQASVGFKSENDSVDGENFGQVKSSKSMASQASAFVPFKGTKSMMSVSALWTQVMSGDSRVSVNTKANRGEHERKLELEKRELKFQCSKLNSQVQSLKRELQALRVRDITRLSTAGPALRTPGGRNHSADIINLGRQSALSPAGFESRPSEGLSFAKTLTSTTIMAGVPQPPPSSDTLTVAAWEEFEHERPIGAEKSLPCMEKRSVASSDGECEDTGSYYSQQVVTMPSTFGHSLTTGTAVGDSAANSVDDISTIKVLDIWMQVSAPRSAPSSILNRSTTKLFQSDEDSLHFDDDDMSSCSSNSGMAALVKNFVSRHMVSPTAMKHLVWETLGVLLILHDAVVIPMLTLNIPESTFTTAIGWLQRIYWTFAIVVNFHVGFIDSRGDINLKPDSVATRYIRSWLVFDVALVLLDWMEVGGSCDGGNAVFTCVISYLQVLRILRLVQLMRAREFTGLVIQNVRSESVLLVASIMKIVIFMVWTTHLIACTWYGIGRIGTSEQTSWVQFTNVDQMSLGERYTRSFHAAFALFFGEHTEYSDPRSMLERTFIIGVLMLCFMMSAWFVSSITSKMTRLSIVSGQDTAHFTALSRYLSDNSISRHLANKVTRNATHAVDEQKRVAPEKSIELLNVISEPLRCELHYEIHSQTLTVHPFFRYYEGLNPAGIRKICHHGIKRLSYSTGDVVFSEGESPSVPKMLFHKSGKLFYCQGDSHLPGSKRRRVSNRNWVCEAVLWTQKWIHRGSLQATSECVLVALDALWFQSIVSKYPGTQVGIYAANFVHDLASNEPEDISDVGEESPELDMLIRAAFPREDIGDGKAEAKGIGRGSLQSDRAPGRRKSQLNIMSPDLLGQPVQKPSLWTNVKWRMLLMKKSAIHKMAW